MDYIGTFAAVICTLIALGTVEIITRWIKPPPLSNRFSTIDGLRGYLGFAVFLHHADIWRGATMTGDWRGPSSIMYIIFGTSSVVLFFMITSFLFITKLLNNRHTRIDFFQLFSSRIFRLAPLYFIAITLLLVIVGIETNWHLVEPAPALLEKIARWYGFTIFGAPDLNGLPQTGHVMSGVYWTLPYEWFFYLMLPFIALIIGTKKSFSPYLIVSFLAFWLATNLAHLLIFLPFIGGAAAAILVRTKPVRDFSATHGATYLVIALLAAGAYSHLEYRETLSVLFLSAGFTLIAGGNSLFGLLTHRLSRMLGEFTYSIYLLHGLLIYTLLHFIFKPADAILLTSWQYWGTIMALTPVLICITAFTFYFIEQPGMKLAKPFGNWIRSGAKRSPTINV